MGDEDVALADQNVGSDDVFTYDDPIYSKNDRIMLGSAGKKGKRTTVWLGFRHVNGEVKHYYYASPTGQEELDEESHAVRQYLGGLKQYLRSYDSPTLKHRTISSRSGICDSNEGDTRPRKRARANTTQGPSVERALSDILKARSLPITQEAKIPREGSKCKEPVNRQNMSADGIDVVQPSVLFRQQMDKRYEDYKRQRYQRWQKGYVEFQLRYQQQEVQNWEYFMQQERQRVQEFLQEHQQRSTESYTQAIGLTNQSTNRPDGLSNILTVDPTVKLSNRKRDEIPRKSANKKKDEPLRKSANRKGDEPQRKSDSKKKDKAPRKYGK